MQQAFLHGPAISTKSIWLCMIVLLIGFIAHSSQQQQPERQNNEYCCDSSSNIYNSYQTARKLLLDGDSSNMVKSVPHIQSSIPMRISECMRRYESLLRCTKLFVLKKLEEPENIRQSGSLTRDFLEQFFGKEEQIGSLIVEKYANLSEKDLNERLVSNFQIFFKNRDIKLHFLPGIIVKIVPSKLNKLKFSFKKKSTNHNDFTGRSKTTEDAHENTGVGDLESEVDSKKEKGGHRHKRKNKKGSYKSTIIQMAVPVMVMPAILLGTFLPFILPVLKMATIMTMLMNNSAFIAALIYAARTHANSQDEQHISYTHPTYH